MRWRDLEPLRCYQAWNDPATGTLYVGTYATASDKRGASTSFRLTNLPDVNAVQITVDSQPFTRFTVIGPTSVRIDSAAPVARRSESLRRIERERL